MSNKPLVASLVAIFSIAWTQALPAQPDIVFGSRNTQVGNTYEVGKTPSKNNSTGAVQYVYGSVTNQTDNRYVTFGKVGQTQVIVPNWFPTENEQPQTIPEMINGPSSRANIMSPERRQFVQTRINYLKKVCADLKSTLYPLIYGSPDAGNPVHNNFYRLSAVGIAQVPGILQDIIRVEIRLQRQQMSLDKFNNVRPWSLPKRDYFDRDLDSMTLEIEGLKLRSSPFIESATQVSIQL